MRPLYRLVVLVLHRPMRHGIRWTIEGLDHLPSSGPALLASNHISYLDPLAMAYVTNEIGRPVVFLAKSELYEKRLMGKAMRAMGHISVARGTGDTGALDAAVAALGQGEIIGVFPEGTISNDLNPMAGKTGVARIARLAQVPVIPLGLWGTHRLLSSGRKPPARFRVAVTAVLGEPVLVGPDDNPREATDRIMAGIGAAVRRARAVYPQVPRPGDDGWWVRTPEEVRLKSCRGRVAQELLDREAGLTPSPVQE